MSNSKKYISLTRLSDFLDNLKNIFMSKTDYVVDENLSSTSSNPIQNKVVDAEFEAISQAMTALDMAIDKKADATHDHDDRYYTETEIDNKIDEINLNIQSKADSYHTHIVDDVDGLEAELELKVPVVRTINGKALNEDIFLTAEDIEADQAGSASIALQEAKEYTEGLIATKADAVHEHNDTYYIKSEIDTKVSEIDEFVSKTYETKADSENKLSEAKIYADKVKNDLLNGAGKAYDTLKELGDLIDDNVDAIEALEIVAAGKADNGHTHSVSDLTNFNDVLEMIDENISQKTQVQILTWEADD